MLKKITPIICAILFIAIFALTALLVMPTDKSVVGTYCSGTQFSPDDLYVCVYSDDTFLIYKQLEIISSGTCKMEEFDRVTSLTFSHENGEQSTAVFDKQDLLICTGGFTENMEYPIHLTRISDTPTEINVFSNEKPNSN